MKLFYAAKNAIVFAISGRKVDFVVAGVQKAGTTAVDAYLRDHPDICMANKKEVHFFDSDHFFVFAPNYLAYHANFSFNGNKRIIGEVTPIYAYWDACAARMWKYNPKMKIILVLRNPIDRAYSHWNMEKQRGNEPLSFLEAIAQEDARCRSVLPKQHRMYSYIDRGMYSCQIIRIRRFFPKGQTLIIKHDALLSSPNEVMGAVWDFLGVSRIEVASKVVHTRQYERPMDVCEFEILHDLYKDEIHQIEKMLDWDCSNWLLM